MRYLKKSIKYLSLILVIFFFLFLNFNSKSVLAIKQVSILGSLVNILPIRNYFEWKNSSIDTNIPQILYDYSIVDGEINQDIESFTDKIIIEFYQELSKENYQSVKIDYQVVTDNSEWFTLKIMVLKIMASSDSYVKYYHIDKKENKIVLLSDLFRSKEYKTIISDEIKKQMRKQMQENIEVVYWIDGISDEEFKEITDNQNFYFNSKNNIVIVFNKYEVAPGSMGLPEFEIDKKVYEKYLK